jgi:hypothetical protein
MTKDPRRLAELLDEGRLGALRDEALRRRKATVNPVSCLSADEAEHVVSASVDSEGALVLVLDSPAWGARLRYRAVELGFTTVKVKVRPRNP